MRNYPLSLLSCAALLMACQPVAPIPVKTKSPSPNLKIKEAAPIQDASLSPPAPPAPQVPPVASMPVETLSSDLSNQNDNQTEIDLAISTVTKSSETHTNSAQATPKITPEALAISQTFDPTKIIGFSAPVLTHNLGRANSVRKEGLIEVWQYQFASCVVDFFFYPIGEESSELILRVWDMRSTIIGDHLDQDSCHDKMNIYNRRILSNS